MIAPVLVSTSSYSDTDTFYKLAGDTGSNHEKDAKRSIKEGEWPFGISNRIPSPSKNFRWSAGCGGQTADPL